MRMKLNYLDDSIIVDFFNSLLPDNYDIDVKFINYRDFDTMKRAVSYDAKCLAKGCPTVTMEVHD